MEVIATVKGQIVIPAALRRKYDIKAGTRIQVYEQDGKIILQPITPGYIREVRGSYKGTGALKVLMEERDRERDQ